MTQIIKPQWPAPPPIHACTTLKNSIDLGNVADRSRLKTVLNLPNEPLWIKQTHSNITLPAILENKNCEGDASYTHTVNQVCIVLTADCLPILVCNRQGTHVAAIHAGWRGLASGIIESTLKQLNLPPDDLLIWLGPAIGPKKFEVGAEVRDAFLKVDSRAKQAFSPNRENHWLADLYLLAKLRLNNLGVTAIYGGDYCTYSDAQLFYSYRRDNGTTGRMGTLIWIS